MIKPIEGSSSVSANFDNLLSNLADASRSKNIQDSGNKVDSQKKENFKKTLEPKKIEAALEELFDDKSLQVKYTTDKETNKLVLKIVDKESDEVVRQYPPEISLKIARIVSELLEDNRLADVKI